jgi:hypothetical protein
MDYYSARKSGNPFKRKYHAPDAWLTTKWPGFSASIDNSKEYAFWADRDARFRKCRTGWVYFSEADLKAEDWEIYNGKFCKFIDPIDDEFNDHKPCNALSYDNDFCKRHKGD